MTYQELEVIVDDINLHLPESLQGEFNELIERLKSLQEQRDWLEKPEIKWIIVTLEQMKAGADTRLTTEKNLSTEDRLYVFALKDVINVFLSAISIKDNEEQKDGIEDQIKQYEH